MLHPQPHTPSSRIDCVDPRARIAAAVLLSIVIAAANQLAVLAGALAVTLVALGLSGLSPGTILRRLLPLNLLMLLLAVVLPLTTDAAPRFELGPLGFSEDGLLLALKIAVKGNAIVLTMTVLLGSVDATTLGHALNHMRVPDKLTHLLLFTVRYLDVLHQEYQRLRAAMKVRCFRPQMNRHTYRAYGYLVGMLLVRSFDRSERIAAAMKCRGFRGRFYLLDHFAFTRYDVLFGVVSTAVLVTLILVEWTS